MQEYQITTGLNICLFLGPFGSNWWSSFAPVADAPRVSKRRNALLLSSTHPFSAQYFQ